MTKINVDDDDDNNNYHDEGGDGSVMSVRVDFGCFCCLVIAVVVVLTATAKTGSTAVVYLQWLFFAPILYVHAIDQAETLTCGCMDTSLTYTY